MPGVLEQARAALQRGPARRVLGRALEQHHHLILLLGLPLLLIGINSNWVFTPIYSLSTHDPWFYTALLRSYFELAPVFPSNVHYFAERLAWLVPGHIVYRLLPHLAANYVLHLAVYYVGVAALYGILTRLSNRRIALLSALGMGSYPWYLRAAGWDYPDGAGVAQMLVMLFLLTLAAQGSRRRPPLLILAGAFVPTLLSTHMFWVGLMPAAALYFLLLSRRAGDLGGTRLWIAGAWLLAGSLVMTGLLALIHQASSGSYNFLENSLRLSRALSGVRELRADNMYTYGAHPPFPNVVPVLLALASIKRLLQNRSGAREFALLAAVGNFGLSYGFLVLTNGVTEYPVLHMFPYTSYLLPSTFLLFGLLLEVPLRSSSRLAYACAVGLAVLLQPLALALSIHVPEILRWQGRAWPLIVFSALLLYAISWTAARAGLLISIVALWAIGFLGGRQASVFISDASLGRRGYEVVMASADAIYSQYGIPPYGELRFWPKWTAELPVYLAVEAIYLYPWGLAIDSLPAAPYEWPTTAEMRDGAIVLIAAEPDPLITFAEAQAATQDVDATLEMTGYHRIQEGDLGLTLVFTQLTPNPIRLPYGSRFEFDQPIHGTNVYPRETGLQGETYVWTGPGTRSDLQFELTPPSHDLELRICARSVLRPKIARSFGLLVNSVPIPTTLETDADGCPWLYTGAIPASVISIAPETTVLTIEVRRTVGPDQLGINPDDHRSLGLALDWIEIH